MKKHWIGNSKLNKQQIAEQTKAKVILCDTSVSYTERICTQGKALIHVQNPRLAISLIADKFFVVKSRSGIHFTSYIDSKQRSQLLSLLAQTVQLEIL